MPDFTTIDYLKYGTATQKRVFEVLQKHNVFSHLQVFTPVLAGTFPIGINIATSDLDILCQWTSIQEFKHTVIQYFGSYPRFFYKEKQVSGKRTVIARFYLEEFPCELFGQNVPVIKQRAFLHLLAEHKILSREGTEFRNKIIALKEKGIKTEPAFSQLLNLAGDPYLALLLEI